MVLSSKALVDLEDVRFAMSYFSNKEERRVVSILETQSPDFYKFFWQIAGECGSSVGEKDTEAYLNELRDYLAVTTYFLLSVWSANGGRLPTVSPQDYECRLQTMGMSTTQWEELRKYFVPGEVFDFVQELEGMLRQLKLYTRCHAMLVMRVVMEAVVKENCRG